MKLFSSVLSGLFHKNPKWTATRKENTRKRNAMMKRVEDIYNAGRKMYLDAKQTAITAAKLRVRTRIDAHGEQKL
jgi:hypothetical protein